MKSHRSIAFPFGRSAASPLPCRPLQKGCVAREDLLPGSQHSTTAAGAKRSLALSATRCGQQARRPESDRTPQQCYAMQHQSVAMNHFSTRPFAVRNIITPRRTIRSRVLPGPRVMRGAEAHKISRRGKPPWFFPPEAPEVGGIPPKTVRSRGNCGWSEREVDGD